MTQLSIASSAPHDTIMDGEGYISPYCPYDNKQMVDANY